MTLWQKITGLLRPLVGTKAKTSAPVESPEDTMSKTARAHVTGLRPGVFNAIGNKLSGFDVYCLARQAGAGKNVKTVKAWRDRFLFVRAG
jgi:hypothetical protein